MNIILFGPPGSGKGTQGDKLVKEFNLFKISTGDLLREEINNKTELGKKIQSIMKEGVLVSDNIIDKLIEKFVSNKKYSNKMIFDGYPRNMNQVQNLKNLVKKYNQSISIVISLKVNKDIIIKRILGRQVCSKCNLTFNKFFSPSKKEDHRCGSKYLTTRIDDNENTIKKRYETYNQRTLPILEFYKKQNLLCEIDGMKEIHVIYEEIHGFIQSLET